MESHSSAGKIMCSKKTADILIEAGKGPWITPREDFIDVKGKGMMQCYWIAPKIDKNASTSVDEDDVEMFDSPEERLHLHIDDYSSENLPKSVRWMTTIFIGLLRDVLIHREATNQTSDHRLSDFYRSSFSTDEYVPEKFTSPRNEVTEMIVLPRLDSDFANLSNKSPNVKISDVIRVQMEQFINSVAKMYINNPFHCFDHGKWLLSCVSERAISILRGGNKEFGKIHNELTCHHFVAASLDHNHS